METSRNREDFDQARSIASVVNDQLEKRYGEKVDTCVGWINVSKLNGSSSSYVRDYAIVVMGDPAKLDAYSRLMEDFPVVRQDQIKYSDS